MKNIFKISIVGLFLIIITSCEKDLDLAPKAALSGATFWQDEEQFRFAANRFYNDLPGHTTQDSWSDIVYQGGDNADVAVSAGTLVTPATDGFWNGTYTRMRRYNALIENGADKEFAIRYVAEARFFRAYDYYRMFVRYGGVPLITKVLNLNSEELKQPRATRTEMIAFILDELDASATNLPKESELNNADKGRITWGAAMALKSRVALFEGTWAKNHGTEGDVNNLLNIAVSASKQVIDSNEYDLFVSSSSPNESYRLLFVSDEAKDGTEQILARRYSESVNRTHNFSNITGRTGTSFTKAFADSYLCVDGLPIDESPLFEGRALMTSEYNHRDPRMTQTIIEPFSLVFNSEYTNTDSNGNPAQEVTPRFNALNSGYFLFKFVTQDRQKLVSGRQDFYAQIIRYGEVLLNYAEAIYERDGSISDDDLNISINKLRDRAQMIRLTNAHVVSNGLNMQQEIRRERTIELAYEGFRWDDTRRWKVAEEVLPMAKRGALYAGTEYETFYEDDTTKKIELDGDGFILLSRESDRSFEANKNYLLPIPSNEILLMEIEQNPNWSL